LTFSQAPDGLLGRIRAMKHIITCMNLKFMCAPESRNSASLRNLEVADFARGRVRAHVAEAPAPIVRIVPLIQE